ncbi:MAG: hypothetical protein ACR2JW_16920, partial [Thermomicrobiales bacterium]
RTLAITGTEVHPRDDGSYDVTDRGVQFVDLATFTETAHLLQQQYQGYARPLTMQWSANGQFLYIGSVGASPPGGSPDAYHLLVMDARTHRVTATQTYAADTDTPVFLRETWFALPK